MHEGCQLMFQRIHQDVKVFRYFPWGRNASTKASAATASTSCALVHSVSEHNEFKYDERQKESVREATINACRADRAHATACTSQKQQAAVSLGIHYKYPVTVTVTVTLWSGKKVQFGVWSKRFSNGVKLTVYNLARAKVAQQHLEI